MPCYPQRAAEGWEVFDSGYGKEIQLIDEPDDDDAPILESDLHAVQVCLRSALAGHDYALSALSEIDFNPLVFGDSGVLALSNASVAVGLALGDEPGSGGIPVIEMLHQSNLFLLHT